MSDMVQNPSGGCSCGKSGIFMGHFFSASIVYSTYVGALYYKIVPIRCLEVPEIMFEALNIVSMDILFDFAFFMYF